MESKKPMKDEGNEKKVNKDPIKRKLFCNKLDLVRSAFIDSFKIRKVNLLQELRNEHGVVLYSSYVYDFAMKIPQAKAFVNLVESFIPKGMIDSGQAGSNKIDALEKLVEKIGLAKDLQEVQKVLEEASLNEKKIFSGRTGKVMEAAIEFVLLLNKQKNLELDDEELIKELQKKAYIIFSEFCKKEMKKQDGAGGFKKVYDFVNDKIGGANKLKEKIEKFSEFETKIKTVNEKEENAKRNKELLFHEAFDEFKSIAREVTANDSSKSTDTSNTAVFIETLHNFTEYVERSLKLEKKEDKKEVVEKNEKEDKKGDDTDNSPKV